MLISLGLVTLLYVAMGAVLVGLRPYTRLGGSAPISDALTAAGVPWAAKLVNVGALLALTTVIMVVLIAQSRLLFAMGRDRLLPRFLSEVSPFGAPSNAAAVAGTAAALLTLYPGVVNLDQLLVLGALFCFLFCSIGVILLRRSQPDLERGFRVPLVPVVPLLSALCTVWLMLNLTTVTWRNFAIWMAAGLALYLAYGRRTSNLSDVAPTVGTHALR
jgi:APA family basic amino acid/polyamine antiporter